MAQISPLERWLPLALASLALSLSLGASGCALLIPPSWRSGGSVPLTGPIGAADPAAAGESAALAALSDEDLLARVEADERRLVELASEPAEARPATPGSGPSSAEELRAIANRLPLAQHELAVRGIGRAGARARHPVIE